MDTNILPDGSLKPKPKKSKPAKDIYISGGEIRDVAIAGYLLGILELEKGEEFNTPEDTKKLNTIELAIREMIAGYAKDKKRVMAKLQQISNLVMTTKENYCVQLTTLGINLLYLNFAWNERRKPLSRNLYKFWSKIEKDVTEVMQNDWDLNENDYEDIQVQSIEFAHKILGGI
nr:MAG TPA: hypothetical protein [Caudoviricetes sp.]